jgi:predicted CXXCH cytochrome family protein
MKLSASHLVRRLAAHGVGRVAVLAGNAAAGGGRLLRLKLLAGLIALPSLLLPAYGQTPISIINSDHNLSVSSPGTMHASSETEICIFCHTPHSATGDGPLWNHQMSSAAYQPYTSGTLKATVGQPNGSSRLCLSCHDGTVALGMVNSRRNNIAMNTTTMTGVNDLGTDLTADHPISFVYNTALATADGNLKDPSTLPQTVPLDRSSQVQCTSCHDPHNNEYGDFLVMDNTGSALCLTCHEVANWTTSGHGLSVRVLPETMISLLANNKKGAATSPLKVRTVSEAACTSCHVSHTAGGKKQLVRFEQPERNCVLCHGTEGPGQSVLADFNKVSIHPIYVNADSHTPEENPVNPPLRHVTCVDCHNPHAANQTPGSATTLAGSLVGVTGVSAGGAVLHNVQHEYELCFRCHGDSAARGPATVTRQVVETNTRRQFNPANVSFHPVEAIGKNTVSPSLLRPLTPSSRMACTDCHNSDSGTKAGGSGANGPHGSAYAPLLERMLLLTDATPYNANNFALCFKCHSSTVVDSSQNNSWAYHRQHLEQYRAACTTCHDSHGATQPHLINFNTTYVLPYNGVIRYTSTGLNHGTCTLTCHDGSGQNHAHNAVSY